ncbi:hydroxymethylglutaryl-CoA lyase [Cupriavidus basilensis]
MADGAGVMAHPARRPGTLYSVLTPNMKGFEGAVAASADEGRDLRRRQRGLLSQKNINCSIAESIARFEPVAAAAREKGLRLRASVSCALGCPTRAKCRCTRWWTWCAHARSRLRRDRHRRHHWRGHAGPGAGGDEHAVAARFPIDRLSGHFHDTYGQALSNILASLQVGISIFHASRVPVSAAAPYAKGATGNVATEDVLYMLHGMGIHTGVDLEQVVRAGDFISQSIGRAN